MGIFDFAEGFDGGPQAAERVLFLSKALLDGAGDQEGVAATPGVALMIPSFQEILGNLNVAVLVDVRRVKGILPGETVPLIQVEELLSRIIRIIKQPPEWLSQVRVFGVYEPEPHISPGNVIKAQLQGTVGCQLRWQGGAGFATAGHVAPTVGSAVFENGARVGTVVWGNDPTGHGNSIEADFAVVELDGQSLFQPPFMSIAKARPYDHVKIVRQNGFLSQQAMIFAFCHFLALPTQNSTVGDMYMAAGQVTWGGDSGAAAILPDGAIIGHVVGCIPGIASIVQDISYQMGAASSSLANLGL